jgi:hypothetical protein
MIAIPSHSQADEQKIRFLMTELPDAQRAEIDAGLREGRVGDPAFRKRVAQLFRGAVDAEGGRTALLEQRRTIATDLAALRTLEAKIHPQTEGGDMLAEVEADAERDLEAVKIDAQTELKSIENTAFRKAEQTAESANADEITRLRGMLNAQSEPAKPVQKPERRPDSAPDASMAA